MRIGVPLLMLAALVSACSVPPRQQVQLRQEVPLALQDTTLAGKGSWPSGNWWTRYDDALLSGLVEQALAEAPRMAGAAARLAAAREQVRVAGAARGLQADLSAQYQYLRLSDNGLLPSEFLGFSWYHQADLGLDFRYQFDWWGKQRAAVEAALDRARAAEVETQAAALTLSAAVAQEYFGWQSDSARLALVDERLAALQSQRQLAERRAAARLESADRGQQIEQQLAIAEELKLQLETSRRLRVVALAALVGVPESALRALSPRPLPRLDAGLPEQLGIDLIAHRPDLRASRWRVAAAQRETDVARASFYPDISLRALAGLSSIELGKLLESGSAAPVFGAALNLPVFDAGLRDARHGAATAALAEAVATYNDTLLAAAREVGTAVQRADAALAQHGLRERQLQAADALLASAEARAGRGLTHRGPVLESRIDQLLIRDSLLQNELEAVTADIQLNQALGGGYSEEPPK